MSVDPLEQVRLLRRRSRGQTSEILREAHVREQAGRIFVKMEEGAGLQVEDSGALLTKSRPGAELLQERREADQ